MSIKICIQIKMYRTVSINIITEKTPLFFWQFFLYQKAILQWMMHLFQFKLNENVILTYYKLNMIIYFTRFKGQKTRCGGPTEKSAGRNWTHYKNIWRPRSSSTDAEFKVKLKYIIITVTNNNYCQICLALSTTLIIFFFRDGRQLFEFLNKEHGVSVQSISRYLWMCLDHNMMTEFFVVTTGYSKYLFWISNLSLSYSLRPVWWTLCTHMPSFSTSAATILELQNTYTLYEFWWVCVVCRIHRKNYTITQVKFNISDLLGMKKVKIPIM